MIRLPHPVYEGEGVAAGGAADATATAAAATDAAKTATADPKAGAGTALDLPPEADDKKIVVPADFPDDWRAKMAGDDKDTLKKLERYKAPADVAKALREAEKKLTSGKVGTADPAPDGTKDPDALKVWREANGIPADPTGYELPKTVQERLTDADKPVLSSFTEFAHKANLPPNAVQVAASWYVEQQEQAFAAQVEADKKASEEVQDELRKDYGQEFRANTTMAKRFMEESGAVDLLEARLPDGRKVGNVTSLVKSLVDIAAQKYGDVSFAGGENAARTASRKEEIEKIRDTDFARYDGDQKLQAEYLEILKAEGKRKG